MGNPLRSMCSHSNTRKDGGGIHTCTYVNDWREAVKNWDIMQVIKNCPVLHVPQASAGIRNEAATFSGVWPHCATRRLHCLPADAHPLKHGGWEESKREKLEAKDKITTRKQNKSSVAIDGKGADKREGRQRTTSWHRLQHYCKTVRKHERQIW